MNAKDVKCPICGTVNRSLDLDETDGWMECEHCHNAVQILEYAIERVRTALKMLAPEERAIIQDFFFTESPIPVKELVEKYAMPKTSIYRKRDDALKALKKILENA